MTDSTGTPRQRRGKKTSDPAATPPTPKQANASSSSSSSSSTPIDQLHSARAKLIVSRDRTADLHAAWKAQLFRLSVLILGVTIYQVQTSLSTCISELKEFNGSAAAAAEGGSQEAVVVSGMAAIKIIFGDSFCELLGLVVASMLALFLAFSNMGVVQLEHWSYMVSSALVPVCLGFFFHSKSPGCLVGEDGMILDFTDESITIDDKRHQFPVVVIYHTIVTLAFWFMKSGMQQCEGHVELVTRSIEDFVRMDKKIEQKKELRGKRSKKK